MFLLLKDFAGDFKPDLPPVVIDLLYSPATSTPSELLFSCAGFLSQNQSARIPAMNLERRCLVKSKKAFSKCLFIAQ